MVRSRPICHLDLDAFYCAVECRRDPSLKGVPFAVAQHSQNLASDLSVPFSSDRRFKHQSGGIIALSYEAKAQKVKRGMTCKDALKVCPSIEFVRVPVNFGKADVQAYRDAGSEVVKVLQTYAEVERVSIDEVYMDLTDCVQREEAANEARNEPDEVLPNTVVTHGDEFDCAARVALRMQEQVLKDCGFSCSIGIGPTKCVAKTCSSLYKPFKVSACSQENVLTFLSTLPLKKLRGLGGKLGDEVGEALSMETTGELQRVSMEDLTLALGERQANIVYRAARGLDDSEVVARVISKSLGVAKNFRISLKHDELRSWAMLLCTQLLTRTNEDTIANERSPTLLTISYASREGRKSKSSPWSPTNLQELVLRTIEGLQLTNLSIAASKFVSRRPSGQRICDLFKKLPKKPAANDPAASSVTCPKTPPEARPARPTVCAAGTPQWARALREAPSGHASSSSSLPRRESPQRATHIPATRSGEGVGLEHDQGFVHRDPCTSVSDSIPTKGLHSNERKEISWNADRDPLISAPSSSIPFQASPQHAVDPGGGMPGTSANHETQGAESHSSFNLTFGEEDPNIFNVVPSSIEELRLGAPLFQRRASTASAGSWMRTSSRETVPDAFLYSTPSGTAEFGHSQSVTVALSSQNPSALAPDTLSSVAPLTVTTMRSAKSAMSSIAATRGKSPPSSTASGVRVKPEPEMGSATPRTQKNVRVPSRVIDIDSSPESTCNRVPHRTLDKLPENEATVSRAQAPAARNIPRDVPEYSASSGNAPFMKAPEITRRQCELARSKDSKLQMQSVATQVDATEILQERVGVKLEPQLQARANAGFRRPEVACSRQVSVATQTRDEGNLQGRVSVEPPIQTSNVETCGQHVARVKVESTDSRGRDLARIKVEPPAPEGVAMDSARRLLCTKEEHPQETPRSAMTRPTQQLATPRGTKRRSHFQTPRSMKTKLRRVPEQMKLVDDIICSSDED